MNSFNFPSLFRSTIGIFSTVTLFSVIPISSVDAFSLTFQNSTFDSPGDLSGWTAYGDASTVGDLNYGTTPSVISPVSGSNQAIITNSHLEGNSTGVDRKDDAFIFNQSGTNPLDSDTNLNSGDLQTSLGFGANAFSIPRVGGIGIPEPRISKEGSALTQEFDVTLNGMEDSFTINFDWAYATNDGLDPINGESDFAFWSLGLDDGAGGYTTVFDGADSPDSPTNEVIVLASSGGSVVEGTADNVYGQGVNYSQVSYEVDTTGFIAGTYTYKIGFGVVDVDGLEKSSALLLDNIQPVPFEFSPTAGLGLVLGFLGWKRLRSRR